MAILKPFRGIRPVKDKVKLVASKPYDVLNETEAKAEAGNNRFSFYRVIKPEIDFAPGFDPHSPEVYKKGKENMDILIGNGIFCQDKKECFYVYRQTMEGRNQTGIVGCASVDDYFNGIIKKHELTRHDKEEDRRKHVRTSMMNYEPVFFAYPAMEEIDVVVNTLTAHPPEYDFTTDDGIGHTFWVVADETVITEITGLFSKLKYTYIADGHHRTAAAAGVGKELRDKNPNHTGNEKYNFFLSVHFPDNQLRIFDYNRVVKDLNGLSLVEFIEKISEYFAVEEKGKQIYRPDKLHGFGLYLEGKWYSLMSRKGTYDNNDPIGVLDVTILYEKILKPILNITDLRTSNRIDFVGGIRGLGELEKKVNSGEMKAAFALYPVSMKQLMDIAGSGNIMPPKTTWFEPKLRSGLVVYSFS